MTGAGDPHGAGARATFVELHGKKLQSLGSGPLGGLNYFGTDGRYGRETT
jgi:hypothetical protein